MTIGPLSGYVIGVTADRRADEQMKLLSGRGAACLHGPVIKTHPLGSETDLTAATEDLLSNPPDLVVLTTALGVRGWLEATDATPLGDALRNLLGRTELLARGPKANGALVTAGFEVAWTAPRSLYDDIVDLLAARGVAGARVAVQLDGAGAGELCDRIEELGAAVVRVPVYRWSLPADTSGAERLVRSVVEGKVDGITFTARPAVDNFLEIAGFLGVLDEVLVALSNEVRVFCVGPVCANGFVDHPSVAVVVPERFRLGAMVHQMSAYYEAQGQDVRLGGHAVRVQGRMISMDGHEVGALTQRERCLLSVLLERPGVVHSKRELLQSVWRGAEEDEHLVEVTVARLRQRLGLASAGIETVLRRGYRVSAT